MANQTKSWFRSMNKLYVDNKLNQFPFLNVKYGHEYSSFKQFCYLVMNVYGWQPIEDIQLEYDNQTFYELNFKRMYETNIREWKRLSKEVFDRDEYTCVYCGKRGGTLEIDHVIPFSKGGSDSTDNLVTACRKCNRQKRDKSVTEFFRWRKDHE